MVTTYVESGQVVTNTVLKRNDIQNVNSGGVARATTVNNSGQQNVWEGGVTSTTKICSGGGQLVHGVASDTTICSGGIQYVGYGGIVKNTIQKVGGNIYVEDRTDDSTIKITGTNANGSFTYSKGIARNFILYNGGDQHIESGKVASATTIFSGASQFVASGGVALNTIQKVGGNIEFIVEGNDSTTKIIGTNTLGSFSYSNGIANNFIFYSGGRLDVLSGGIAKNITQNIGGNIIVRVEPGDKSKINGINANGSFSYSNGIASNFILYDQGVQFVFSGGVASATTICSGGSLNVDYGGVAKNITQEVGGCISVTVDGGDTKTKVDGTNAKGTFSYSKGIANNFIVYGGGLTVASGGVVKATTICSDGRLDVERGGVAKNITQEVGGNIYLEVVGGDSATKVTGTNANGSFSYSNGIARNFILYSGMPSIQHVTSGGIASATLISGGNQFVYDGGIARTTTILSGGYQDVTSGGVASATTISSGGSLAVYSGGVAKNTTQKVGGNIVVWVEGADKTEVSGTNANGAFSYSNGIARHFILYSGCQQAVDSGGVTSATTIFGGGSEYVGSGGIASATTINEGGLLQIEAGGKAAAITLNAKGTLKLTAGNVLSGKNGFTGATVTGGTTKKRVALAKKASLTVGTNTTMKKLHLNASNANLSFTGTGNTLGSLKTNKSTAVSYDVSKVKASATSYMLSLSTKNTQKLGKFSVNVKDGQGVGVYELSKNIAQAKNTVYTINLAGKKQGTAKLNGLGLIKDAAIYAVNSVSNKINLTVAKTGKTGKLTGTANWDVFYGSVGNDTITGNNGRDVAVYDAKAWGKDTIKATKGTLTLLFKDLTSKDIKKSLSNDTMTITKKSDSKQKITVKNWSDDTHSIVFGSKMTAFDKYIKAASPSTTLTNNARNEAFKKAGLASA